MKILIHELEDLHTLEPLTCKRALGDCIVGGMLYSEAFDLRINEFIAKAGVENEDFVINIAENFWPSEEFFLETLARKDFSEIIRDGSSRPMLWLSARQDSPAGIKVTHCDSKSRVIQFPWDLLNVHEEIMYPMAADSIEGTVRENVTVDGNIKLGKNSVLLPGVYIEGNVIIGENTKVGPNCYIRGSTYIGNNCHIGQAVEIKNSILMDKVSAGHLSYIGDSIVCPFTNFGAGSITANFRHDGKNHRSSVDGRIMDTGRRKFGTVIGDHVHTGIHTSIFPGRKIWPGLSTMPGDLVKKDLK